MQRKIWLLTLVSAILLNATPVLAGDGFYVVAVGSRAVGTKITSLPYTITSPGLYYLGSNLNTAGHGITVDADDVTLDLMGFRLTGGYIYAPKNHF